MAIVLSRNFAIATLSHNSPLRSSGDINFHTVDSDLYFFCSAGVGGCPLSPSHPQIPELIYMWLTNQQRLLVTLASKQTAECRTAIQIQTSDCC